AGEALEQYLKDENVSAMRKHAWMVFAGLTQPATTGKPMWTTWHYRDETFDPKPAAPGRVRKFYQPRQLQLGAGAEDRGALPVPDTKHDLPTANHYNEEAYRHIRANNFHLAATLTDLNSSKRLPPDTPLARRRLEDFPNKAVVIKTMWW